MRVALLTSSRADYGIYKPLIKRLDADPFFDLEIIAFGTHLSRNHGYTLNQIERDGFQVKHQVASLLTSDSTQGIASSMGLTSLKFADLWAQLQKDLDLIICLGDRYEMFAAVSASVPFNIPVAHLHGGETTLGAIDNKFRHAITIMSSYHFTATELYAQKVSSLMGSTENVYFVGALSLDNLEELSLFSIEQFQERFDIDLSKPSILSTFHPETVTPEKNIQYTAALLDTFAELKNDYQIVITMPNADTMGNLVRRKILQFTEEHPEVIAVENFGIQGYFSCIQHCAFLLGNTSSGIIEAASFKKWVINIGDRQKGRMKSANVIDVPIDTDKMLQAVKQIQESGTFEGPNVYKKGNSTAAEIVNILKNVFSENG